MYLRVKSKYYDIMITNFEDQFKSHSCLVNNDDLYLFTKKEFKYLQQYIKNQENYKLIL